MQQPRVTTADAVLAQVVDVVRTRADRLVLGIVGPPGVGKSTVAGSVRAALLTQGIATEVLPMDGFHLSNAQLSELGLRDRKGAPETFDVRGLLALLARVRTELSSPIFIPGFTRDLDEAVAAAGRIDPDTRVVIVEGNYLLLDQDPWDQVRSVLDLSWYLDAADDERETRLAARHMSFGRTAEQAWAWIASVDHPNAELIKASRPRADVITRVVTR